MIKLNVWNMKNTKKNTKQKKSMQICNSAQMFFTNAKYLSLNWLFKNFPFCNQLVVPALNSLQNPQCANNVP